LIKGHPEMGKEDIRRKTKQMQGERKVSKRAGSISSNIEPWSHSILDEKGKRLGRGKILGEGPPSERSKSRDGKGGEKEKTIS